MALGAQALLLCKSKTSSIVLRGDSPQDVIADQSAAFDLLIIGTSNKENWLNVLLGTNKDVIVDKAACSVLRLTIK